MVRLLRAYHLEVMSPILEVVDCCLTIVSIEEFVKQSELGGLQSLLGLPPFTLISTLLLVQLLFTRAILGWYSLGQVGALFCGDWFCLHFFSFFIEQLFHLLFVEIIL